jgi:D-arabinose 1-dehydrogenase-like Zn-dependent alcohol dehydrogenase
MSEVIDGLAPNGKLMVVGATMDPITDAEDTLRFAELTGVRPMIETYQHEKAAEAYERMMSGNAQFRVVLTM